MQNYLTIGKAAEYLGISEQTLRRWDADGSFEASFVSPGGHRFYSLADLATRTKGVFRIAKEWASATEAAEPMETFYCPSIEKFKTRLERMVREMGAKESLCEIGPIISSVAGEIGNNSFDHNIGNWPDVPGAFFAYDLGKRTIALADRGRGVLTTLRNTKADLKDDADALHTAFTEVVTGRAPEHRGNGLKYVRKAVTKYGLRLQFQSGNAEVALRNGNDAVEPSMSTESIKRKPHFTRVLKKQSNMKISISKFGYVLTSRQAGKDAYAAFLPTLSEAKKGEEVVVDFDGVHTFSPSWGDEFLTPLHEKFGNAVTLVNAQNPSVSLTVETLEGIHGYKLKIA